MFNFHHYSTFYKPFKVAVVKLPSPGLNVQISLKTDMSDSFNRVYLLFKPDFTNIVLMTFCHNFSVESSAFAQSPSFRGDQLAAIETIGMGHRLSSKY